MSSIVYSIGARLRGGGIGHTAYHAVMGLYRCGRLAYVLCSSAASVEFPSSYLRQMGMFSRVLRKLAVYDPWRVIDYVHCLLYDRWAARYVLADAAFYGWNAFVLHSLRTAKVRGCVTFIERASTHPQYQYRILQEEYERWGVPFRFGRRLLSRLVTELQLADYVVVPSPFVRDTFLAYGYPQERIIMVSFGVDTRRFSPSEGDTDARPFRVLFVGQVNLRKGVLYLLEAWRRLAWRDAELWVVGRIQPEMRVLLQPYRDLPGVHWVDYTQNLPDLYRRSHVFVLPTLEEGSALVTYEAMASGLPLIVTEQAGSLVRDGVEGFIVPVRDVDALCEKLEVLRAHPQKRVEMGKAARRRVAPFTWEAYGEALCRHLVQRLAA